MTTTTKPIGITREVLADAIADALKANNAILVEEETPEVNYAKTTTTTKTTKKKAETTGVIVTGMNSLEDILGKSSGKKAFVMPYAVYKQSKKAISEAGFHNVSVLVSDTEYNKIHAFTKGN